MLTFQSLGIDVLVGRLFPHLLVVTQPRLYVRDCVLDETDQQLERRVAAKRAAAKKHTLNTGRPPQQYPLRSHSSTSKISKLLLLFTPQPGGALTNHKTCEGQTLSLIARRFFNPWLEKRPSVQKNQL